MDDLLVCKHKANANHLRIKCSLQIFEKLNILGKNFCLALGGGGYVKHVYQPTLITSSVNKVHFQKNRTPFQQLMGKSFSITIVFQYIRSCSLISLTKKLYIFRQRRGAPGGSLPYFRFFDSRKKLIHAYTRVFNGSV